MRSILAVTVPAQTFNLTTVEAVKLELGITDGGSDARIAAWIKQASGIAVRYCDRPLAKETVSETFRHAGHHHSRLPWLHWHDSRNADGLRLTRYPIVAIDSLTVDGTLIDPALYECDETEVYRLSAQGYPERWHFGKSIVAVYSAGYVIPIEDRYADLERAVIAMVRDFRAATYREDPFLKSRETVGVARLEWWVPTASTMMLPPEISGMLDPFVRKWGFMN